MKNRQLKTDGFISLCFVGACPEIKKEKRKISIRNSKNPETIVKFSPKEWDELRNAIKNNTI